MRRKLAAGNWKMNGSLSSIAMLDHLNRAIEHDASTDVVICPPVTLLNAATQACAQSHIAIGAQDCHSEPKGAFTGDVSAEMIAETGANHIIVGHSERRDGHHETDATIRAKALAAIHAGMTAIICIGESEEQREAGTTLDVLGAQLMGSCPDTATGDTVVVAYEPIWAIGTGKVPSFEQIVEVHNDLRAKLVLRFGDAGNSIRLLYGGSVKASNAQTIFAADNVDGALVGGASLTAEDFAPIVTALQAS
ncbi:MAG: triose-phosphate isomerase [Paracoccaceae bacterium]